MLADQISAIEAWNMRQIAEAVKIGQADKKSFPKAVKRLIAAVRWRHEPEPQPEITEPSMEKHIQWLKERGIQTFSRTKNNG
jgi:hypothetical protein